MSSSKSAYFDVALKNGERKSLLIGSLRNIEKTDENMAIVEDWIHENLGSRFKDKEYAADKIDYVSHSHKRAGGCQLFIEGLSFA